MTELPEPTAAEVEAYYARLDREAEASGYHLNPDRETTWQLVRGLLINKARYGYQACPCRLASGDKRLDLDIICPCDYRDPDLSDYGACYCSLYVDGDVRAGKKAVRPVPERRPAQPAATQASETPTLEASMSLWRCRVCGYLCARHTPPEVCPICKAKKERFEVLKLAVIARS